MWRYKSEWQISEYRREKTLAEQPFKCKDFSVLVSAPVKQTLDFINRGIAGITS